MITEIEFEQLDSLTIEQLLERFTAIGIKQDEALLKGEWAKFNRLFDTEVALEDELSARKGDQRQVLMRLYNHSNPQVRMNAAEATMALAPKEAGR